MRIPVLVSEEALTTENRWALVASLFAQGSSSVASAIALFSVIFVCWMRTGWAGFAWVAVYTLAAVGVPVWLRAYYHHRRRGTGTGVPPGSPEVWARRFVLRTCVLASAWSVIEIVAFVCFDDIGLQFFVITIGAGWLAGAAARNAASPAGVLLPLVIVVVSQAIGVFLAADHFVRVVVPFYPLMLLADESIGRYIREQTVKSMMAEQRLAAVNEQLLGLSTTDGLTGIGNRRCFDAALETAWAAARRDARSLALVMLDVDYFKRYNDHYGHLQGDECLRAVATCAQMVLQRPADLIARYGGEEFVALLPDTDEHGACDVADRLRLAVQECRMPHAASPLVWVTVSAGVASIVPQAGTQPQDLLALADQALYSVKQTGRNAVRTASALPAWSEDEAGPRGTRKQLRRAG